MRKIIFTLIMMMISISSFGKSINLSDSINRFWQDVYYTIKYDDNSIASVQNEDTKDYNAIIITKKASTYTIYVVNVPTDSVFNINNIKKVRTTRYGIYTYCPQNIAYIETVKHFKTETHYVHVSSTTFIDGRYYSTDVYGSVDYKVPTIGKGTWNMFVQIDKDKTQTVDDVIVRRSNHIHTLKERKKMNSVYCSKCEPIPYKYLIKL